MRKGNTLIPVLAIVFALLAAGAVIYWGFVNPPKTSSTNTNTVTTVNTNTGTSNTNEDRTLTTNSSVTNADANANTDTTTNTNTSTSTNTSTNTNTDSAAYFKISQWGVELPKVSGIEFVYAMSADNVTANFSTTALNSKDHCGTGEDGIGTLSRYTTVPADGPLHSQTPIIIGGYYYYHTSPQSACSQDSTVTAQQTAAASALTQSFAGLRASN